MHARLVTAVSLLLMLALQGIPRYDDLRGHQCVPQRPEVAKGACNQCQGAYNQTKSCFELDTANKQAVGAGNPGNAKQDELQAA